MGLLNTLYVYWPALFVFGTVNLMLWIDTSVKLMPFPPIFDTSGTQAKAVLTSPWVWGTIGPTAVGLVIMSSFVKRNSIPIDEHASMVWWLTNVFWFHLGCDVLSGLFPVMPVMKELYVHMNPAHTNPLWHEARQHLDAGYGLELIVEIPLAAYVLYLYARRDPARHFAEVFACAVQMGGTVMYYMPGLAKGEAACFLSWMDRACGSVWIIYPFILLRRHMSSARLTNGKTNNSGGKKKH